VTPPTSISTRPLGDVGSRYAGLLLDYLRTQGVDPTSLFPPKRVAEIKAEQSQLKLSAEEYVQMLESASQATGDPDLGFKTGISMQLRHLGVVGHILMCCANLDDMLSQYQRYVRLVHGIGQLLLVRRDDRIEMPLDWPGDPPPLLAQLIMSSRVKIARLLCGRPDEPVDVDFQFVQPAADALYRGFFGGRVRFAQARTALVFPAGFLSLPVVMADSEMAKVVRAKGDALLQELSTESSLVRTLKAALEQNMLRGRVSIDDMATAMGMSVRTLTRRLEEEGQCFRDVLADVRRRSAEQYLRQGQPSLAEVAFLLGYAEQSGFQRAFRRWTGKTPRQYRRRHGVVKGG
jgi:AraC-like DNA-binding protein